MARHRGSQRSSMRGSMKKPKFKNHIYVAKIDGDDIIVGTPEDPGRIDADDGDWLAIYVLQRIHQLRVQKRI